MRHRDFTGEFVHVPHTFEYADATARAAATGFVPDDVGKLALQLDDFSFWVLSDDDPATWVAVGGSGGGAAPDMIDPTTITGCVRWYDAAQESGAESDAIATLTDYSSAGVDSTQSTGGSKALLRLNAANGHPAWQFDGIDDFYDMGTNLDLATNHTVLIVAKVIPYTQTYSVLLKYKQRAIYLPVSSFPAWGTYSGGPIGLGALGATPQLLGFWGSSNSDWYAVNGKTLWKGSSVSFDASGSTVIGRDTGGTQPFAGFLMEFIAFNTKIAQADLLALTKHLHYKWGISDYA